MCWSSSSTRWRAGPSPTCADANRRPQDSAGPDAGPSGSHWSAFTAGCSPAHGGAVHGRARRKCCGEAYTLIARGVAAEETVRGTPGDQAALPHPCPEPHLRDPRRRGHPAGRVSTSKRPMRHVEPARPQRRRTGLSDAAKAGERESQSTLGITAGLARDSAPSIPNRPALRWIARAGRRPRSPVTARPDG